jgi:hypothetical protein
LARYLAIDWDNNQLYVVAANAGGGAVRVQAAAAWREEQPLSTANAAAVGQRLREHLKAAKIAAAPVVACLGRDRVIIKDIRYPAVPPHEEPAVVRFQAVKELTSAAEDVVIDYTPLGAPSPGGEQRSLVLIAKRELVNAYQALCHAAGLKLVGLTPRPFGLAACLDRLAGTTVLTPAPEPAGSAVAVVALGEGWAEFCVSRGGVPLLARSLTPGPHLAAEVRRNLAVYNGQAAGQTVKAVYVAGGPDNAGLRQRLHDLLDLPVHLLDPFAGSEQPDLPPPDKRGGFAGLVGLLYLQGDRSGLPNNFVRPKQPKPPRDPNRRRLVFAAAAGLALLVVAVGACAAELASVGRKVDLQRRENADFDRTLAASEDDGRSVKALGDWTDSSVVWLDELYDLTDRFPDPDKEGIRLAQLTGEVVEKPANAKTKDKFVAKMSLKGVTGADAKPVDLLVQHLVEDKHYRPDFKQLGRNTGPDRFQFMQQFTIPKVDVEKLPPDKYTRRMEEDGGRAQGAEEPVAAPPGRGGDGRGRRGGDGFRRPGGPGGPGRGPGGFDRGGE